MSLPPQKITYPTLGKEKKSSTQRCLLSGGYLRLVFMEGSRLWGHCAGSRDPSNFHRNRIFSILRRSGFFSPAGNLVTTSALGLVGTRLLRLHHRDPNRGLEGCRHLTTKNHRYTVGRIFSESPKMLSICFSVPRCSLHGTGIFTKPFPLVHVTVFHL